MPAIKLNPSGVAGGPAILPVSSLWSRPDDVLANVAISAAPISVSPLAAPGRPSVAEHQVFAQNTVLQAIDLHQVIDTRVKHASANDSAATQAPVVAWHNDAVLHLELAPEPVTVPAAADAAHDHAADTTSAAPEPALAALLLDKADAGDAALTFLTVCSAAFRGPDVTHGDPHELLTLPIHDGIPIDGAMPMFG